MTRADDLRLGGQIAHDPDSKGIQVIGKEGCTGEQQGNPAHQHVYRGEFLGDRVVLDFEHVFNFRPQDSF